MPYSVFLLDETMPVPAADIGKRMQTVLGGVTYDHVHSINTHHGWIARELDKAQADRLLAELKAAGHEAIVKDESGLVGIEQVVRIRRAVLGADVLRVEIGLLGELRPLPWDSLSLVSIGRVQVVQKKTVKKVKRKIGISRMGLAMGVPLPVAKKTTTTHTETQIDETLLVQLVFGKEGILREIRPSSFDYGYLGDRLRPTNQENFRLFLRDLAAFSQSATWTRMARDLAERGEPPNTFHGEKDLLRFTQWRLEASFDLG